MRVRQAALGAAAGLVAGPWSGAAAQVDDRLCGRTLVSMAQVRADFARDLALRPPRSADEAFDTYTDTDAAGSPRLWFVSRPEVTRFQAVVCRHLVSEGGRFFVKADIRCAGPKAECDRLPALFEEPAR